MITYTANERKSVSILYRRKTKQQVKLISPCVHRMNILQNHLSQLTVGIDLYQLRTSQENAAPSLSYQSPKIPP